MKNNNIITFGDMFWIQQNGAAMGILALCAVNYAFLYMGLLEMEQFITDFAACMPFSMPDSSMMELVFGSPGDQVL